VGARDRERGEAAVQALGPNASFVQLDVTQDASVDAAVAWVKGAQRPRCPRQQCRHSRAERHTARHDGRTGAWCLRDPRLAPSKIVMESSRGENDYSWRGDHKAFTECGDVFPSRGIFPCLRLLNPSAAAPLGLSRSGRWRSNRRGRSQDLRSLKEIEMGVWSSVRQTRVVTARRRLPPGISWHVPPLVL
jgi:hypothetical protein